MKISELSKLKLEQQQQQNKSKESITKLNKGRNRDFTIRKFKKWQH